MKIDDVNTALRDHDSRLPLSAVDVAAGKIMDLGGIASSTYTAEESIRAFQRELEARTGGQLVLIPAEKIPRLQIDALLRRAGRVLAERGEWKAGQVAARTG